MQSLLKNELNGGEGRNTGHNRMQSLPKNELKGGEGRNTGHNLMQSLLKNELKGGEGRNTGHNLMQILENFIVNSEHNILPLLIPGKGSTNKEGKK